MRRALSLYQELSCAPYEGRTTQLHSLNHLSSYSARWHSTAAAQRRYRTPGAFISRHLFPPSIASHCGHNCSFSHTSLLLSFSPLPESACRRYARLVQYAHTQLSSSPLFRLRYQFATNFPSTSAAIVLQCRTDGVSVSPPQSRYFLPLLILLFFLRLSVGRVRLRRLAQLGSASLACLCCPLLSSFRALERRGPGSGVD